MKIRAIIDTNVWVSALINKKGFPAELKERYIKREFEAIISTPLIDEISEVLRRPRIKDKYKITDQEINDAVEILVNTGIKVNLTGSVNLCRDKKDNFVLETAMKGKANYLITRDDDIKRDLELIRNLREYDE